MTDRDQQQFDALSHALQNGDVPVARRRLQLAADPKAEVGPDRLPGALFPVLARNIETIRPLQRAGVDCRKLRYQGATAPDYARNRRDVPLGQALDPKAGRL